MEQTSAANQNQKKPKNQNQNQNDQKPKPKPELKLSRFCLRFFFFNSVKKSKMYEKMLWRHGMGLGLQPESCRFEYSHQNKAMETTTGLAFF